jgi:hypothetical protein
VDVPVMPVCGTSMVVPLPGPLMFWAYRLTAMAEVMLPICARPGAAKKPSISPNVSDAGGVMGEPSAEPFANSCTVRLTLETGSAVSSTVRLCSRAYLSLASGDSDA